MKIFVVGATGRVGQGLIQQLANKGHVVYAGARSIEKIQETEAIKPVYFDLHSDIKEMINAFADAEAIYFVAGSRGKDLLQSDLFGAVKVMQATEKKGIKRYIHLSSVFALEPDHWNESFLAKVPTYNIAKFFSDHWLIDNTQLDYTILQPGHLEEVAGTGQIEVSVTTPDSNPIEDVVTVLVEVLERENTIKKVIKMHKGSTAIVQALKTIGGEKR